MSQVQNNTLHNFVQPAALLTLAYLAGSKRFIQYFPGASQGGLCLAAGVGSAIALASPHISKPECLKTDTNNENALHSFIRVTASLALGTILTHVADKVLKGRVSLCIHATGRLIAFETLFAGLVAGISSIGLLGGMENEQQVQDQNPGALQTLPEDVMSEIFTYLGNSPSLALASKRFYEIYTSSYVQTFLANQIAFDLGDRSLYFREVGKKPPLPVGKDTHHLILIPQTIDGSSLKTLGEIIKGLKSGGHCSKDSDCDDNID